MLMQHSQHVSGEEFAGGSRPLARGAGNTSGVSDLQDSINFYRQYRSDPQLREEVNQFSEAKKKDTCVEDEAAWRSAIRHELEQELNRRVRDALGSPTGERTESSADSRRSRKRDDSVAEEDDVDSDRYNRDLTRREREYLRSGRWKVIDAKRRVRRLMSQSQVGFSQNIPEETNISAEYAYPQNGDVSGGGRRHELDLDLYHGLDSSFTTLGLGVKSYEHYAKVSAKAASSFGSLSTAERHEFFYAFTKDGFREALRTGRLPDGSEVTSRSDGRYVDKHGIVRDVNGPFWPADFGPLCPTPVHCRITTTRQEALNHTGNNETSRTVDTQSTPYTSKWRGVQIVFDSERSVKDAPPPAVSEGNCPSLVFESRFESGNLRQARRVGQFEYELVLQTDLYTARHTQWYYFRVQNALPGVTYKFKIINLLKKDSLYNHGMKPVLYSDHGARLKKIGWFRSGHHVSYSRNITSLHCPLLQRDRNYYMLEWQMEFPHAEDTCYLAHCYPYTFTDLKDDLDSLLTDPDRSKVMKREVMCETKAGNSCFLVTVTNFDKEDGGYKKKAVVVSARVHPGETNSSWMMKGLLDFISGSSRTARELRNKFVFKIVPMLNPDGVIVGNYRCSLAARDLNRNYRHPRKDNFPTIWHIKTMMEDLGRRNDIMVYCDLHGHSRKHNVFMYGCGSTQPGSSQPLLTDTLTESFLQERLFPWLMSQKSPEKFWFRGCKFHVRRSKESTGRVVMFRQMKIFNSFTMEATFCGTTICKGEKRHFNMADFQHMGQVFSEVVLEYYHVQQDKTRQSEVILELTRAITQQALESRGILPKDLPDFSTEAGREALKAYSPDGVLSTSEQITAAFMNMLHRDKMDKHPSDERRTGPGPGMPRLHMETFMDAMSGKTIDGCVQILDQLHVAETAESDSASSDSDSESDPEMKPAEVKQRRKKKKQRKNSKSEGPRHSKQKDVPERPRSASGLPAIHTTELDKKKKQQGSMGKYVKTFAKSYPTYVNKYMGRSNGGIPCFSEERLIARAAKRLAEMKRRMQERDKEREEVMTFNAGVTEEEYQRAYATALKSVESDLLHGQVYAESLQKHTPVHIRTTYMHGGNSPPQDGSPSRAQAHHQDPSSDSEPDEVEELHTRGVPLAALNSPYQTMGGSIPQQSLQWQNSISCTAASSRNALHLHRNRLPPMRSKTVLAIGDNSSSAPFRHATNHAHNSHGVNRSGQGVNMPPPSTRVFRNSDHRESKPNDYGFAVDKQSPHFLSRQYTDMLMLKLVSNHVPATTTSTLPR